MHVLINRNIIVLFLLSSIIYDRLYVGRAYRTYIDARRELPILLSEAERDGGRDMIRLIEHEYTVPVLRLC